jgi:hypothetical protein
MALLRVLLEAGAEEYDGKWNIWKCA